jgi:predicted DNA-binding transcriptional regulator YafY
MPQIKHAQIRFRIIDRCLRNHFKPYPTKSELREACEEALFGSMDGAHICDSTIEKDMFNMKMEHDAPIRYSKRHGGYYYEDSSYTINDIPLSEEDLEAIKFAAYTLSQFREVDLFKQFGQAIDKIVNRVAVSGNPNDQLDKHVQFETAFSSEGQEWLPPLLSAVHQGKTVEFSYASFRSSVSKKRTVLPVFLKEYRNRWYVICQDLDKQDIMTYALDRISELTISDKIVQERIPFDAEAYFRHAIGISVINTNQPDLIRFQTDTVAGKYIQSQPFHLSQQVVKEDDDSFLFEMQVIVTEELIRNLLSFGGELLVLEPSHLKETMAERVTAMKMNYEL